MRLIIALAVVTWGLIVITTAVSIKTIAATAQTKTEARANSAPIYGVVRVTTPNGMKPLPAELVPLP
jgi:hypothetical protein